MQQAMLRKSFQKQRLRGGSSQALGTVQIICIPLYRKSVLTQARNCPGNQISQHTQSCQHSSSMKMRPHNCESENTRVDEEHDCAAKQKSGVKNQDPCPGAGENKEYKGQNPVHNNSSTWNCVQNSVELRLAEFES